MRDTERAEPRVEPEGKYRVPSQYKRCRSGGRGRCQQSPVADLNINWWNRSTDPPRWWAYCAYHMRKEYNREVCGDRVWWLG